jgi:hypothetical protein
MNRAAGCQMYAIRAIKPKIRDVFSAHDRNRGNTGIHDKEIVHGATVVI